MQTTHPRRFRALVLTACLAALTCPFAARAADQEPELTWPAESPSLDELMRGFPIEYSSQDPITGDTQPADEDQPSSPSDIQPADEDQPSSPSDIQPEPPVQPEVFEPEQPSFLYSAFDPSTRLSRVPNMFGDFFGGGSIIADVVVAGVGPVSVVIPQPGGASTRQIKLSENNSPRPQNRFHYSYNRFNDVIGGIGDVNRHVFGIERTFLDGLASLDVRAPFAWTLDHDQSIGGPIAKDTEFGNVTAILKVILRETDSCLLSAGCGVGIPTGDDISIVPAQGPAFLHIDNRSIHVLPYFALMCAPNERCFWQTFVQLDIDTNGNPVSAGPVGAAPAPIGVFNDQTLMFIDTNLGFFLYEDPQAPHITAIAPMVEAHYSATLQTADVVATNGVTIRKPTNRYDVANLTAGVTLFWRDFATIRPAVVVPLGDGNHRQFDYEAGVQLNIYR